MNCVNDVNFTHSRRNVQYFCNKFTEIGSFDINEYKKRIIFYEAHHRIA
jgi:hypothetical protein